MDATVGSNTFVTTASMAPSTTIGAGAVACDVPCSHVKRDDDYASTAHQESTLQACVCSDIIASQQLADTSPMSASNSRSASSDPSTSPSSHWASLSPHHASSACETTPSLSAVNCQKARDVALRVAPFVCSVAETQFKVDGGIDISTRTGFFWTGSVLITTAHGLEPASAFETTHAYSPCLKRAIFPGPDGWSLRKSLAHQASVDLGCLNTAVVHDQSSILTPQWGLGLCGLGRNAEMEEQVIVLQPAGSDFNKHCNSHHGQQWCEIKEHDLVYSFGTVVAPSSDSSDGFLRHTAFTTKGSSGSPVIAVKDGCLLGMSFFREQDKGTSVAERFEALKNTMADAVGTLAQLNYAASIEQLQAPRLFLEADRRDSTLSEVVKEAPKMAASARTAALKMFHAPTRDIAALLGDLVHKFTSLAGKERAEFDSILGELTFDHFRQRRQKTLISKKCVRFDKQNSLGVFALQRNDSTDVFAEVHLQGTLHDAVVDLSQLGVNQHGAALVGFIVRALSSSQQHLQPGLVTGTVERPKCNLVPEEAVIQKLTNNERKSFDSLLDGIKLCHIQGGALPDLNNSRDLILVSQKQRGLFAVQPSTSTAVVAQVFLVPNLHQAVMGLNKQDAASVLVACIVRALRESQKSSITAVVSGTVKEHSFGSR